MHDDGDVNAGEVFEKPWQCPVCGEYIGTHTHELWPDEVEDDAAGVGGEEGAEAVLEQRYCKAHETATEMSVTCSYCAELTWREGRMNGC